MTPMRGILRSRIRSATMAAAGLLTVVIGVLLWTTYDSQLGLRRSAGYRLQSDCDRIATSVAYFFAERNDDIQNLSECRELSAYFENQALGMTMEYGLKASELAITERFQRMLDRKRFNDDLIYSRIVFLKKDGSLLVDVGPESNGGMEFQSDLSPDAAQATPLPVLLTRHTDGALTTMVSMAYSFKGSYEGRLLAWISPTPVFKYLLKPEDSSSERKFGISCPDGALHLGQSTYLPLPEFTMIEGSEPLAETFSQVHRGTKPNTLTVHAPVKGTCLSVAMITPESEVFGENAPWVLPAAMGITAALLLGGGIGLWFFSNRNTALQVRLEETAKREGLIHDKNLELKREIDERKRFETALAESEAKYRSIFESFQDVYIRTDEQGRVVIISPSIRTEGGYVPEELIGQPSLNFFADPTQWGRVNDALKTSGSVSDYELKLLRKNGDTIDVSMTARLIPGPNGVGACVEGVLRDVTRRKKDQEALEENRRQLNLALKGGDLGVWDWDLQTGHVTFSPRWASMLGYEVEDIAPHVSSWERLVHPADRPWVEETLEAHLEGRTPYYESEHRLKTKSGSWKWILDRGQVVKRDESGEPIRMAGTHMDITPKKTAEIQITEYRENLERLVAERTQDLEDAQKELVTKAMEAGRAQLAAMVLHNIGNAVTPIRVQLDRVKADSTEQLVQYLEKCIQDLTMHMDDLQHYVREDERGGKVFDYMTTLVLGLKKTERQRMENLSRLDDGVVYISEVLTLQQSYASNDQENKERVVLRRLIEDAARMQTGALEKRNIKITYESNFQVPPLVINKNRLMQVIINIIKNGYEAIEQAKRPNDDRLIRIETFFRNGRLGFSITDNGVGLDPKEAESFFEFGRSSKGSSGFGLYYCRMFVEANRGRMELTSPGPGKGAKATVWFPTGGGEASAGSVPDGVLSTG